jgi:hypothetical protein
VSEPAVKTCIYPGCERAAVPPHPLGGPQPAFCDREDHNALSAHLERQRRQRAAAEGGNNGNDEEVDDGE